MTLRLSEHVQESLHIRFGEKLGDYQSELFIHIAALLKRLNSNLQFNNPLTETIRANYSKMFEIIQDFSPEFYRLTGKVVSPDEIALLVIYFSTIQAEMREEDFYFYKAVVLCNHGTATGNLLAASLKNHFNIVVDDILSSREIEKIDQMDVDIVFSTVEMAYRGKPILLVSPILRELELQQVRQFLESHPSLRRKKDSNQENAYGLFREIVQRLEQEEKALSKTIYDDLIGIFQRNNFKIRKERIQPMIADVMIDDYIEMDKEAQDWQEAIRLSAAPLLQANIIESSYIDAMIESVVEHGPYIVIGPHLALAHARPEDGANQLGLSVVKLRNSVPFHHDFNDPVQLVFCLSAVDSFSHLNIMRELVNLIHDAEKVNRLCQAHTVNEFKEILFH